MINLLKSLFISAYATYVFVAVAIAISMLLRGFGTAWLGVLLAHAPMAFLFARLMTLKDIPRSHPWLPWITAMTLAGFALAMTGWLGDETLAVTLGMSGAVTYFFYLFWYSRFRRPPLQNLTTGKILPGFKVTDVAGQSFSTDDLRGHPAVLLFFRGNWCPLCMAQIKEIAAAYRTLAEKQIQVVMISPQPQSKTASLAKKFDTPMRFVVDTDNRIARQLGIAWEHGLPAGMQLLGYD
ncbi:MAG: peroxiredoxin family protein, partial [Gammaproteobacteria bacterium]|nr:peroxiredoxin family protein [Gammaproteobacteria bacterium]